MKNKTLLSLSHAKVAEDAEFNANYAIAEVVAGYARQRAQRQIVDENGKLSHTNTNPQTLAITGVPADWVITKSC